MNGTIRLLPALALGAIFATQADASDVYHLSTHGDWDVILDAEAGNMSCAASTVNNAEEVFDLTIKQDGGMQMYVLFEGKPGVQQINLDVVIEGVERWELDNVTFTEHGAVFNFPDAILALEFMADIQNGRSVGITRPREQKIVTNWSLRGSRDAINGLFECYRRITGVGA